MSRHLQARCAAALLVALLTAVPAPGRAEAPTLTLDPLQFFSDCLGRVAALRVDRQSWGDSIGAEEARALQGAFEALVGAMTPEGGAGQVRGWRAEARAAQATLMTQAALRADAEAAALAAAFIGRCASMVVLPETGGGTDPT